MIVLMPWFYLTSAAVLIGAEVNSEMESAAARIGDLDASLPGKDVPTAAVLPVPLNGNRSL